MCRVCSSIASFSLRSCNTSFLHNIHFSQFSFADSNHRHIIHRVVNGNTHRSMFCRVTMSRIHRNVLASGRATVLCFHSDICPSPYHAHIFCTTSLNIVSLSFSDKNRVGSIDTDDFCIARVRFVRDVHVKRVVCTHSHSSNGPPECAYMTPDTDTCV
jgi:hypothetical protein